MKKKVFISFRFEDGNELKNDIENKLSDNYIISKSESKDRSNMSEDTIWLYLREKLSDSSLTICILTPKGLSYNVTYDTEKRKNVIDDWLYDEQRYSLEQRDNNRTNGIIALYNDDSRDFIMKDNTHTCSQCNDTKKVISIIKHNTLLTENICNVKEQYKDNSCSNLFNMLNDSYVSFVHIDDFLSNPSKYIENAISKRDRKEEFNLTKRING